jgi:hypothetical protein
MPAIAEPIVASPEIDDIQTALRNSDYLNPSGFFGIARNRRSEASERHLLEYFADLALNLTFVPLEQKLLKLADLHPNWDTYGADPPNVGARTRAESILAALRSVGVIPKDVIASSEGGVAISFMHGEKYADIECLNSGETLAVTVSGDGEPYVWEVEDTQADIAQAMERIRDHVAA